MFLNLKAKEAARTVLRKFKKIPKTAIVLGSGLGGFVDHVKVIEELKFEEIPHFPKSTVLGHTARLVLGSIDDKKVLVFLGRSHFYEGYTMQQITFYIYVLKLLKVENVILTNATGGINENLKVGDLALVTDHIKFTFESPLKGQEVLKFGERFPDMTNAYTDHLLDIARQSATETSIDLKEAVYAFMSGPNFETKAEIRALRILGADIVGMSTVPEVLALNQCKINTLVLSIVTNMAAGILNQPLTHEEVLETGKAASGKVATLLTKIIEKIG